MTKFKCDICGCSPEFLWMYGSFGVNAKDNNDYCEKCFAKTLPSVVTHIQPIEEETEQIETENILSA